MKQTLYLLPRGELHSAGLNHQKWHAYGCVRMKDEYHRGTPRGLFLFFLFLNLLGGVSYTGQF